MIVKKIPARPSDRRAGGARAKHVRALVDYLRSPEKETELREYLVAYMASRGTEDGPERLIHIGARNFVCEDLEGQRAEMMAVAQAAVRSPNPIDHWLISWREGELPSSDQVDETVAMFVDDLGLAAHQCIYAAHGDTHNRHVHIAINRYNPNSMKVVTVNKGFTREVAHKAIAKVVDRFGWEPEAEARYVVVDGEPVLSRIAEAKMDSGIRPIRAGAAMIEVRTGYRSAQRIAQEDALPILLGAKSWSELHVGLGGIGIQYNRTGTNGAVLVIGDAGVKASDVSRKATVGALEKRLGEFLPRSTDVVITPREPLADILPHAFRADEFRAEREAWRSTDRSERARLGLKRPPADYETWLHRENEIWFAERWRNRNQPAPAEAWFSGKLDLNAPAAPAEIDGYRGHQRACGVCYARDGEGTAFIDRGASVTVLPGSDEAMLAALRLAIMKFDGEVRVNGDAEFKRRTYELALRHGLAEHITNPDLVARLAMERRRGELSPRQPETRGGAEKTETVAPAASEETVRQHQGASLQTDDNDVPKGLLALAKRLSDSEARPSGTVRSVAKGPSAKAGLPTTSRNPGRGD